MFSEACVKNFVHGGCLCPSMHHKSHDQVSVSGGVSVQGGSVCGGCLSRGGLCLWGVSVQGRFCLGVSVQGGLCRGGSQSRGVSVQGGSVRSVTESPRTVTSGRYASYWNAFLYLNRLLKISILQSKSCYLFTPSKSGSESEKDQRKKWDFSLSLPLSLGIKRLLV